jgi:hypothetical protein
VEGPSDGLRALRPPHANPITPPHRSGGEHCYVHLINPNNPGVVPDPAVPLTRTKQVMVDTTFARCKHYYQSLLNIKQACFTALDLSINVAFQVLNDPSVQGWHAGMSTLVILNQLFKLYGHPTPVILEQNNKIFCSPWLPISWKSSSGKSRIVSKLHFLVAIRTWTASSSITQSALS